VLTLLLFSAYGERRAEPLRVGQPSPETFTAGSNLQVPDPVATERKRQEARQQVDPIYVVDEEARSLALQAIRSLDLPEPVTATLVTAYEAPEGLRASELAPLIARAARLAPEAEQAVVAERLRSRLIPTATEDERLTKAARDAVAGAVTPVLQQLRPGDVIIEAGEPITQENLRALEAIGLYDPETRQIRQTTVIALGAFIVAVLLSLPVAYAAVALGTRLTRRQFLFLLVITLAAVTLQRASLTVVDELLFVLLVPLLVATFMGNVIALLWLAWTAIVVALLVPGAPLTTAAALVVGGLIAIQVVSASKNRITLLVAGIFGGLATGVTVVALQMLAGGIAILPASAAMLTHASGGLLAGILALGLVPLGESVVEFITDFRLTELSSPQHPLLQRLVLEAPGTYQHTQVIANLVEQSVQQIGGNALLARVGALYHDVGKLTRPNFFVENQSGGENPHDHVSPHLSYLIITSHVRDGVELLSDYGLPPQLEPFVSEHHGTTVLAFFYKRALEETEGLDALNFRYPGPKPQSKESAVLMLADAVESASRTLTDPSQGTVRDLIDRLFEERLQDGQLAESPLNFKDLDTIANTFERVLTATMHRRVNYPKLSDIERPQRG
jgi:putative nucleotidyltransferase with HDIG domain